MVDPAVHRAIEVGDEALLLAAAAPTVVAPDRVQGARRLLDHGVDLIIMDDGFQDPALAKDLTLVAVDAAVGIGNGHVLPLGPLRAPLDAQLRRDRRAAGDRRGDRGRAGRAPRRPRRPPHLAGDAAAGRCRCVPRPQGPRLRRHRPPAEILRQPDRGRAPLVEDARGFPDHHVFTEAEARQLIADAEADGLRLVTTEKDMARLAGATGARAELRERTEVFAVTLEFEDPAAVGEMIADAVGKAAMRRADSWPYSRPVSWNRFSAAAAST